MIQKNIKIILNKKIKIFKNIIFTAFLKIKYSYEVELLQSIIFFCLSWLFPVIQSTGFELS
jgi:hypothetical protein